MPHHPARVYPVLVGNSWLSVEIGLPARTSAYHCGEFVSSHPMTIAPTQRLTTAVSQAATVALPALLPLLPPLLRGELRGWAAWGAHLLVSGLLVGLYFLNTRVALPRLLLRGRGGAYLLLAAGLIAAVLGISQLSGIGLTRGALGQHGRPRPDAAADRPGPPGPLGVTPGDAPMGPGGGRGPLRRVNDFAMILLLSNILVLGAGTLNVLNQRRLDEAEGRRRAERARLETELAYLRTQLNPHVFFNTLNTIYALTELDVEQARQALLRLSRLMRYLLAQTHETQVQLSQEVEFLTDYVGLMQLRLTPNMQVVFERPETLRNGLLATMLLQPFVENAFKYGVSTTQPATIFIGLTQDPADGTLTFEVRNQVFPVPQSGFAVGSGIGLSNTRRRLELLYPGRHILRVTEHTDTDEFTIHLTLPLT
ncbi:sensor histidine kinase [Hymenobacter daecheongensis]|nr:histidine kinase [Hymenobacter daecheongensis]